MAVEVRLMSDSDDAAAVGDIVRRAYFALPDYPRDREYDVVIGEVAQRAEEDEVAVALLDGRIVGCLTYVGPDSEHYEFADRHAASFRYFGVDPSVQGRGVGEAMVKWCIERARQQGHQRLRIHTLESMPGARRLYERLGFVRDPQFDENWDGIIGVSFVLHW